MIGSVRFNGETVRQSSRNKRTPMPLGPRQKPAVRGASRPPAAIAANFANEGDVTNPMPTSPGPIHSLQRFRGDFRCDLKRRFPPTVGGSVPRKRRYKPQPEKNLNRHQSPQTACPNSGSRRAGDVNPSVTSRNRSPTPQQNAPGVTQAVFIVAVPGGGGNAAAAAGRRVRGGRI